jgi:hypothetical protein
VLTGFTFLTGYVPSSANFFDFAAWGPYTETNMRVTDCGCFGDFIKLVPKISFFKDLVLLIPAFYFVFRHKDMHQLFTTNVRNILISVVTVLLVLFCLNNFYWGLPVIDFRPFKVGTDLYQKKTEEEKAAAAVKIISMKLQNNKTGEIKELSYETYMKDWAQYPKEDWKTIEQIKSENAIPPTKISEFSVMSVDGFDVAEDILTDTGNVFLVVAYKLKGESSTEEVMVADTAWVMDTVAINKDSFQIVRSIGSIGTRKETKEVYSWDKGYVDDYVQKVNVLMEDVMKQGGKVYAIAGGAGEEKLTSFKEATGGKYDWYEADDILLKTIIRSNPGVVHIKAGKVIAMWHIRQLPKSVPLN